MNFLSEDIKLNYSSEFLTAHKIRHANNTQTVCHAAKLQCWSAVRLGRHIYTATSDPGAGTMGAGGGTLRHTATMSRTSARGEQGHS